MAVEDAGEMGSVDTEREKGVCPFTTMLLCPLLVSEEGLGALQEVAGTNSLA